MYVYEGSPRRSPRRIDLNTTNSNILKPKQASPIRKGALASKGNIIPSSSTALSNITGTKQRIYNSSASSNPSTGRRKVVRRKVNDENKENCNVAPRAPRAGGLGVNGNTEKGLQPLASSKTEINGRLPLKEIPLNGFLEKLRKREVAPSVEIMSTVVTTRQEGVRADGRGEQQVLRRGELDDGIGIGNDWESGGVIR